MGKNKKDRKEKRERQTVTISSEFKPGMFQWIEAEIQTIPESLFNSDLWLDGYYVFSHKEIRKREFDPSVVQGIDPLFDRLTLQEGDKTVKSYLMEIGLWRQVPVIPLMSARSKRDAKGSESICYEEIFLKREEQSSFFLQKLRLVPAYKRLSHIGMIDTLKGEWHMCYWRPANTRPRSSKKEKGIFRGTDLLKSMEVVLPEMRCHFFLTTGIVS